MTAVSTPPENRERRPVRLWPAIAVASVCAAVVTWVQVGDRTGQSKFLMSAQTVAISSMLLVAWWTLLSRLRWKVRLIGLAVLLVAGLAAYGAIRIRGVTGNLVPILAWSWSKDPEAALPRESATGESGSKPISTPPSYSYPQFLGPDRNATVGDVRLARDWSARPPKELWRREVGAGWSSFAVQDGMAITQEQRGPDEMVVAYDLLSGDVLWSHGDPGRFEETVGGIGPRATPTIADDRVYTLGATGRLNAIDRTTGEPIWSRNILEDNNAENAEWGKSCSPLVLDGLVVVSAGGKGKSLVAYDRESGEPVWAGGRDASGYSSPLLTTLAGVPQILIFNRGSVVAHDPATGEELWSYPWPEQQPNVAQPLPLPGDRVLVSSGYGVGSKLLHVARNAPGDPFRVDLLWESPRLKAKFTTIVFRDGYVYGLDDGVLVCLDPETGERRWKQGRYGHGQVLLVGDVLLVQTEDGEIALVEANPERHVELGRVPVVDGRAWNTPALAGPYLLVRNDREAVCLELPLEGR
jgi:outer membrane protein assembly factor BamB